MILLQSLELKLDTKKIINCSHFGRLVGKFEWGAYIYYVLLFFGILFLPKFGFISTRALTRFQSESSESFFWLFLKYKWNVLCGCSHNVKWLIEGMSIMKYFNANGNLLQQTIIICVIKIKKFWSKKSSQRCEKYFFNYLWQQFQGKIIAN